MVSTPGQLSTMTSPTMVLSPSVFGSSNSQSKLGLHIVCTETDVPLRSHLSFLNPTKMSSGRHGPDEVSLLLQQRVSQQQAARRAVVPDHPHTNLPRSVSRNPNFRRRLPPADGLFSSSIGDGQYPAGNPQSTFPRRTGSFLLHGHVNPLIDHHEINRRQRRSSLGAYQLINNNEPIPNLQFSSPPRNPTPPPPAPSPTPPATPMNWLDGSTRKEQYESIDRANKGLRGLCKKILTKLGVRKEDDEIQFYEEGKEDTARKGCLYYIYTSQDESQLTRPCTTGSVRRYRLDLDEQGNVKDKDGRQRAQAEEAKVG